jgi:poly(A) polymerase
LPRLERLTELEPGSDPLLRLAALLPDGAAAATADALKLSNADRTRLEQALGGEKLAAQLSAQDARRLLYRLGAARFKDKVMLQMAETQKGTAAWRMLLDMADSWQRPRFPLTGRDVMQSGVAEGPDVGRVLAEVEDWWVEGDFTADESALRDRLRAAIGQA